MNHGSSSGMQMDHGSMPGMNHGSSSGMQMDRGAMIDHGSRGDAQMDHSAMPSMSHGSMSGTQMDRSAMPGMRRGSKGRMAANHDSMPGMSHGSTSGMQMDHGSMSGMSRPSRGGMQMAHSGHAHAQGTGTVNSVDAAAHKVNVSHGPISAIGRPAMTMDFAVAPSVDLRAVKPGSRVNFMIEQGEGGMYVIQSIKPVGGGRQ
jgi:Cu/Ag efflux protein CusF